jgi:hypothetical protein
MEGEESVETSVVEETSSSAEESGGEQQVEQQAETHEQQVEQTAEQQTEEKPKEQPKKDLMAPRFAALQKRERSITESEKKLKEKEQQLEQREKELGHWAKLEDARKKKDWQTVVASLNPSQTEEELKETMAGISDFILRQRDLPPEVLEVKRKLRELELERENQKKAEEDKKKADEEKQKEVAAQQEEQNKRAFMSEIAAPFIKKNAANLEVLAHILSDEESPELGERVLKSIYDECDKAYVAAMKAGAKSFDLDAALAKAAEKVESETAGKVSSELQKLLALEKLKPKTEPQAPQTPAERRAAALSQISSGQTANPRPRSLTNSVQQAPIREASDTNDPEVLFQRALKLL